MKQHSPNKLPDNIEVLLKQKLQNLELSPPPGLFDKIIPPETQRNALPVALPAVGWAGAQGWLHHKWRVAAAVAILAISGYGTYYFVQKNANNTNLATERKMRQNGGIKNNVAPNNPKSSNQTNALAQNNQAQTSQNTEIKSPIYNDQTNALAQNNQAQTNQNTEITNVKSGDQTNTLVQNNQAQASQNTEITNTKGIDQTNTLAQNSQDIATIAAINPKKIENLPTKTIVLLADATFYKRASSLMQNQKKGKNIHIESMKDVALLALNRINKNDDVKLTIAALQNPVPVPNGHSKQNFSLQIKGYELSWASSQKQ